MTADDVGHNLSFDAKMLAANGVEIADANLIDTILMAGLVLRGEPNQQREGSRRPSLANAVKAALRTELPKTSQLSPWWRDRLPNEQIAYAALDAVMALRLAAVLQPRIDRLPSGPDGKPLLERLCAAIMPVARMELAGIRLERSALAKQIDVWEKELTRLKDEIAKLGIENPSSGPQISVWLQRKREQLGGNNLSRWPRTPRGELSTKAKHLQRPESVLPEAGLLVQFSSLAQLCSNFGNKLLDRINQQTGRVHGNFLLAKAKSGRFSSANRNLQNIPKSEATRSVFVPAPGSTFVVADYSQLELRVMAAIAQDAVMTEAYRAGADLHAVTAAGMLGINLNAFDLANPSHNAARQKAKAVNFGVIYGSGASGLQEFARDAYGVQ